ncbi:MAG: glycerate kinase [Burkholderiales bacterium]|nr:glycerate kinase [Burkholderiales bacterium]
MNLQKIVWPALAVVMVGFAWRGYGWPGVALAVGAIVMWMLMHFSRMMRVLHRASRRPVGWCDSAVMLNAKLRPGVSLLHVLALTRALGELVSPQDTQPEVFRWTDGTQSSVTCEFADGRLVKWELARPAADPDPAAAAGS